jgi:amino acid transporter
MDILTNYIYGKTGELSFKKGVLLLSVLFVTIVGLAISSFLTIETMELLGIVLGSLAGALLFLISLVAFKIFLRGKVVEDVRHRISLSSRRKIVAVMVLGYLIIVALYGGDGKNPIFGISTIWIFAMLAYFVSTSDQEKEEIEKVADDIVWQYESEQRLEEEAIIDNIENGEDIETNQEKEPKE